MRITDLTKMREIVYQLKTEDADKRAKNRAAINHEFNGGAPYTDKEAQDNGILTNVQPLMAPRLAHDARLQLQRSLNASGNYFNVEIDFGPPEQQRVLSKVVGGAINKQLRENAILTTVLQEMDANEVLHGRGPALWNDSHDPIPVALAIEDLKVPSGTYRSFSNLSHFAVYMPLSAAELMQRVVRKRVNPGWNVPYAKKVISALAREVIAAEDEDEDFPEKLAEAYKQDGGYYASDKVPTAKCWAFFQLVDEDKEPHWEMSIFEDPETDGSGKVKTGGELLFRQKTDFPKRLSNILHVQYADGCNVPPFRYHSVRGLGYMLYPVMRLLDRYFCRATDAYFDACNQMFRNVGEEDRDRLQHIQLGNMSIIPNGVQYVTANERYAINHNVMNAAMSMLRQFVQENSASFTQDQDSGTAKEMTATEAMARVQQATALVGSMLSMQATWRFHFFTEVCRRYCIEGNRNDDVRELRDKLRKRGVPDEAFDFDRWNVRVDNAVGGGNKTLELAQTGEMFAARAAFPPKAQRIILHDYALARYDNPAKVEAMLPDEQIAPTRTEVFANLAMGTLLQGLPVALNDSVNLDEYAGVIMNLLGAKMQQVGSTGQLPSPETVVGIQNAIVHVGQVLQQIAQDPEKTQAMRGAMQGLKQMQQQVQAWASEIQSQQGQAQLSPEAQSKIISSRILAENQASIKEAASQQRLAQREQAHTQKIAQSQVQLQADLEKQDLTTANELRSKTMLDLAKAKSEAAKGKSKESEE